MNVLLDACLAPNVRNVLEAAGHDVIWAGDWREDPGDEAILAEAHRQGRVLVTLDKDFGELGVLRAVPHFGIIRLVNFPSRAQATVCERLLASHANDLRAGAILTARTGKGQNSPRHQS